MSKHLSIELENLRKDLLLLTAMAEEAVKKSIKAVVTRDSKLAKEIQENDHIIDKKEVELEEECLKILALHQPVAGDLRAIIGYLKVNNALERIADLAVNIAERAYFISARPDTDLPFDYTDMSLKVFDMLDKVIKSMIKGDVVLAKSVIVEDKIVDEMNRKMYQKAFSAIKKNPEQVEVYAQYLAVSRHLERIGDYSKNIAEDVIYMIEGNIVRHTSI